MDRRAFLLRVGVGGLASSFPVAIAACTPEATESTAQQSAQLKPSALLFKVTSYFW